MSWQMMVNWQIMIKPQPGIQPGNNYDYNYDKAGWQPALLWLIDKLQLNLVFNQQT